MKKTSRELRKIRKVRIRAKIAGTRERPRLSVFRSNRGFWVEVIDDEKGTTIASAQVMIKSHDKVTKTAQAEKLGLSLAKKLTAQGIKKVVFDRGGFLYHGRIKSFAEGARQGGLSF